MNFCWIFISHLWRGEKRGGRQIRNLPKSRLIFLSTKTLLSLQRNYSISDWPRWLFGMEDIHCSIHLHPRHIISPFNAALSFPYFVLAWKRWMFLIFTSGNRSSRRIYYLRPINVTTAPTIHACTRIGQVPLHAGFQICEQESKKNLIYSVAENYKEVIIIPWIEQTWVVYLIWGEKSKGHSSHACS